MPLVSITRPADAVALVTLDDGPRYNALSAAMIAELRAAFSGLGADRTVRSVVVTGEGRGFCAGADLGGSGELPPSARDRGPVGTVFYFQEELAELILAIHELPQPVIAAVHGAAVGGGLAIALASDLRIATTDAFFASQFIRVGLSSCDVGTSYFLPRLIPPAKAAELMFTGRRFSAEEADRLGLLNRVVAGRDELLPAALALATEICANSEYGVLLTKVGMWTNFEVNSLRHAIQLENRTQVLGTFTGNMTEAGRAFRDKRAPEWRPM